VEIGVGSGVIAIELLLRFPILQLWAVDVAEPIIELARQNAIVHGVSERIQWVNTGFEAWRNDREKAKSKAPIELWVSNPPYLLKDEMTDEVADYEPEQALCAPAEDPLYFYREIAKSACAEGAKILAFEVPHERATEIRKSVCDAGWSNAELTNDLTGRPRVLIATRLQR
jgi:release factor glutamine methyltransferase